MIGPLTLNGVGSALVSSDAVVQLVQVVDISLATLLLRSGLFDLVKFVFHLSFNIE